VSLKLNKIHDNFSVARKLFHKGFYDFVAQTSKKVRHPCPNGSGNGSEKRKRYGSGMYEIFCIKTKLKF
jgi:hypothetical protein